ncbi:Serine/threonine-protein kinase PrkC [Planctomycetes bacterium Poly30]|uniref:Serine/threonine-protein kinase PrkC n=1 Tax=Saltatorellus ferox TaxID=2528018 RepID=A0A518ESQ6_9BACT|nr:Serine/threonine-protein kinase PrkC [Planctomycetes bacterium Poly30]
MTDLGGVETHSDSDEGNGSDEWNGVERRNESSSILSRRRLVDGLDDSGGLSDSSDVMALALDQLITDYFDAQREGRAPSVEDFVAAHPEHEHALRAVLPGASLLDQIGKRAEDASPMARSGDRLGEYKLLGVLGRGGMGVVYEAVQETLGRPVALKVLPASRVVDRKSRERFMREAQAAASLQHPGIVPVYGVGEADGQVYYAMQRVDGVPLDVLTAVARGESASAESSVLVDRALSVVARLRGEAAYAREGSASDGQHGGDARSDVNLNSSDTGRVISKPWISNAVLIAQQIAEALSYAHSRGVLHRDVKPSNVMLDESGRAYVTDFGLCKVEDSSSLTAAGDVVGTLRYVPPERFQGRDDARGDVYGVGMILYELLCGRPAFDQKDRATLVQAVTLHAPPRPRKLNPEIPEDLERIVLTAIAKLPEERYLSSEALISDLAAFQGGRPIRARAPGKLYLAKLFARRNRGLVITAAASALILAVVVGLYVRDLSRLLKEVEAGRARAERMFYHAQVHAAAEAARNNNGGTARALRILDRVEPELRDWVWETMQARCEVGLLTVDEGAAPILSMALDSTQASVAVLREEGLRVHDGTTGALLFEEACELARAVAFVPGSLEALVSDGAEGELRVVTPVGEPASERATAALAVLRDVSAAGVVALDASDRFLACAWDLGRVAVLDMDAESPWAPRLYQVDPGSTVSLALYGKEGRAAFAVRNRPIRVLGPESGRVRRVSGTTASAATALAGASGSDYFVAQGENGSAVRYQDKGQVQIPDGDLTIRESGTVNLAISPDGEMVIGQFQKGRMRIWSKVRGPAMVRVASYLSEPSAILWPSGGDVILTGGLSGEWRVVPRPSFDAGVPGVSEVRGHYSGVQSLSFDEAGEHFATAETSGAWSIWSTDRHLPQAVHVQSTRSIRYTALASVGGKPRLLAAADQSVGVWWIAPEMTAQAYYDPVIEAVEARGVAWLRPGGLALPNHLLTAAVDGRLLLSTSSGAKNWTTQEVWKVDAVLTAFDHHRGSGVTVIGAEDGRVWSLRVNDDGTLAQVTALATFPHPVTSAGIGTLAETVAVLTRDERLHLIDMNGSRPSIRWSVEAASNGSQVRSATAVAADEASGWVVTAGADGALQLWSVIDGLPGPLLESRYGTFTGLEFPAPDSPPISVEERGRVTFIETEGVARMRELASIEPSDAETLLLAFLAPRVRLVEIERILRAEETTARDLEAAEEVALGLANLGRYYNNVSRSQALDVLKRVRERRARGQ